ncbi:sulfurtransferase [Thiohalomonas denitrificans]|uniref:Sulfurtransferase n=1 Tax=Thiohalomonas denitrificans TaxID=415747 RepID=A0A1G5QAF6_9GAMM|nr:sulfurtransferase [Thiohalomonas denitrificans]SCZ58351.1 thiosulfate/3-mercaptopyruvate sulfurtransferase [Thiohalomonas denitrificans]
MMPRILSLLGACLLSTSALAMELVNTDVLTERLDQVVLIDAESPQDYARAHIPGAVNLHYLELEDADENAETGLPIFPQLAASKFGALGIANDSEVVVYDSGNGRAASAVWYTLRFIGHERVSLLDGGFRKWLEEGRALSQRVSAPEKVVYKPQPKKEWALLTSELDQGDRLIVDARSIAEYSGKEDGGARRGGHIPGAISLPWDRLSGELQTFADEAVMRTVLEEAGITPDREVVTYCNPGIGRSTFLYAALKHLGYDKVRVYPGSWNEWAADTARPIER